jgi:nitrogen fixation-related uncharacterized protein
MVTGDLISTGMLALFFVLFLIALIWGLTRGQFRDIEDVKYQVFEDNDDFYRTDYPAIDAE